MLADVYVCQQHRLKLSIYNLGCVYVGLASENILVIAEYETVTIINSFDKRWKRLYTVKGATCGDKPTASHHPAASQLYGALCFWFFSDPLSLLF